MVLSVKTVVVVKTIAPWGVSRPEALGILANHCNIMSLAFNFKGNNAVGTEAFNK